MPSQKIWVWKWKDNICNCCKGSRRGYFEIHNISHFKIRIPEWDGTSKLRLSLLRGALLNYFDNFMMQDLANFAVKSDVKIWSESELHFVKHQQRLSFWLDTSHPHSLGLCYTIFVTVFFFCHHTVGLQSRKGINKNWD